MIIPSIDLMHGKAVQLRQGREKLLEKSDPLKLAAQFDRFGDIALIDLNAAMGNGNNRSLIKEICKIARCRVGGGIRSNEDARELVSYGAVKIIIGTKAFENDTLNYRFLSDLNYAVGKNRIIIAIDSYNKEIVTSGWKHRTGLKLFDVIKEAEQYASGLLFTCVEREGCLQGTDMETIRRLKDTARTRLTVAGGIHSLEEIKALADMEVDVQIGMAIYTGKIELEEAFVESLNWEKGLIPTVTRDTAGQVLMLAYSSKQSLKRTFETKKMWYFSRSRNSLWMKGETSGNIQDFIRLRVDCDGDALLATVKQRGSACHLGDYSCFGEKEFSWMELYDVIENRLDTPLKGSYTASLTDKELCEKIMEEAGELVEAGKHDEIVWEAADLLYFMTVLIAKSKVSIDDVLAELKRRRRM